MKKISTALAGYGAGGRIYNAPVISSVQGFSIDMILTSNPENIKAANEDFPTAQVVGDYHRILNNDQIDLVIVLLPNYLHFEFARQALEAGKHVVVEKPITPTVREADELIRLSRKKGLILSVNHNRRWDSDARTIQKLLKEQKLGAIREYEAHFDRFRNQIKNGWKENPGTPGNGILFDLGSHLIDQAITFFGSPMEVFADIRKQRDHAQVPDNFDLMLFYPNVRVHLKAGTLVKEKGPTYSIHGTMGSYLKYGMDPQEEALKNGGKPDKEPDWGKESSKSWGVLNTVNEQEKIPSVPGDYRIPYQNLYQAILGNEELLVTPEQAREVIRIIETAYKSHATRKVISL